MPKWTARNMVNAVYAVENNILTKYAASQIYRIPRRTLSEYIKKEKVKKYLTNDDATVFEKPLKKDTSDANDNEMNVEVIDTETSWFNIQASWYCHACKMDKLADMRQCNNCCRWYHETCVGLTPDDMDPFECPIGCYLRKWIPTYPT